MIAIHLIRPLDPYVNADSLSFGYRRLGTANVGHRSHAYVKHNKSLFGLTTDES